MSEAAALTLSVLVDLLGLVGAVLVAIPFLNESSLKKLRATLAAGLSTRGFARAESAAADAVSTELSQFRKGDRACVIWGLAAIGGSYALHIVTEVVKYAGR